MFVIVMQKVLIHRDKEAKYAIFEERFYRKKKHYIMMGLLVTTVSYLTITDYTFPCVEVECSCWTPMRCGYISRTTIIK